MSTLFRSIGSVAWILLLGSLGVCPVFADPQSHISGSPAVGPRPQLVVQLGHNGFITAIAFSTSGSILASVSSTNIECDGALILQDAHNGDARYRVEGDFNCLEFNKSGDELATGSSSGAIQLWQPTTGQLIASLHADSAVTSLSFSADGKTLACGCQHNLVQLWDVNTSTLPRTFRFANPQSSSQSLVLVALSPDGKLLAASTDNRTALWNTGTGAPVVLADDATNAGGGVAFSPNGTMLAASGQLWDVATVKRLPLLNGELSGQGALTFSADGHYLWNSGNGSQVSAGADFAQWDLHTGRRIHESGPWSSITSAAVSPDGKSVAATSDDMNAETTEITVWDLQTAKRVANLHGDRNGLNGVRYSLDGSQLVTTSDDDTVRVWEAKTGRLHNAFKVAESESALVSPDGHLLLTTGSGGSMTVRDLGRGAAVLWHAAGNANALPSFSADGRFVETDEFGAGAKLIRSISRDARTGKLVPRRQPAAPIAGRSPDGMLRASEYHETSNSPFDQTDGEQVSGLSVLNAKTGKTMWRHIVDLNDLQEWFFSPDGRTIATVSHDWTVKLWEARTGKLRGTLAAHHAWVNGAAFSPDGRVIASVGNDWTVRYWSVATSRLLATCIVVPSADGGAAGPSRGFLTYTPDGYYDGSPGAAIHLVRWRLGEATFGADKFAPSFHRPDLVAQSVAGLRLPEVSEFAPSPTKVTREDTAPRQQVAVPKDQVAPIAPVPLAPTEPATTPLQRADLYWNEGSYARALKLYREGLAAGGVNEVDEVNFRIAVSLGKTKDWDDAIETSSALLATTPHQARVLYFLGRLYVEMPHYGWRVGSAVYHRMDAPKVQSADKPAAMWLNASDAALALDYLERAKLRASVESGSGALSQSEIIDLNFDLAALLPRTGLIDFGKALDAGTGNFDTPDDSDATYDRSWIMPRKVIFLYNEIVLLEKSGPVSQDAAGRAPEALLAESLFAQTYKSIMSIWVKQRKAAGKDAAYPYNRLDAAAIWRSLIAAYPANPIAAQAQLFIARAESDDSLAALSDYRELISRYPASLWVSDARSAIAEITREEINATLPSTAAPMSVWTIEVDSRNVSALDIAIYRVPHLEQRLGPASLGGEPRPAGNSEPFTDFDRAFGTVPTIPAHFGSPIAFWKAVLKGAGTHVSQHGRLTGRAMPSGAYLVVLKAGRYQQAQLMLVSNLAIARLTGSVDTLIYAANARTGRPWPNASVQLHEKFSGPSGDDLTSTRRGTTAREGLFSVKTRGKFGNRNEQQALVWNGNDYAISTNAIYEAFGNGEMPAEFDIHFDRPLYRPGQSVYFRVVARKRFGNRFKPLRNTRVTVVIEGQQSQAPLYRATLVTSAFGTISGVLHLPAEAHTEIYTIKTAIPSIEMYGVPIEDSTSFRVEEYKRPEYQVTLAPPLASVLPGQAATFTARVRYYFNEPVANATVSYIVRCTEIARPAVPGALRSPRDSDRAEDADDEDGDEDEGEKSRIPGGSRSRIFAEGNVRTDASGIANVTIQTEAAIPAVNDEGSVSQWTYSLEIQVSDASRRVVTAQTRLCVERQPYTAAIHLNAGYLHSGVAAAIGLSTVDFSGHPVSAEGRIAVYRLLPDRAEQLVYSDAINTDAGGRASFVWPHPLPGQFRIAFEPENSPGLAASPICEVWVADQSSDSLIMRLHGLAVISDSTSYKRGDVAHVLLADSRPNALVLFTQVAAGAIMQRQLVQLRGHFVEVSIPIREVQSPNFSVVAVSIGGYVVESCRADIAVPPRDAVLKISVHADKATYVPGEKAIFTVRARDQHDKPVRAEVSLSLYDASLIALQPAEAVGEAERLNWRRPLLLSFEPNLRGGIESTDDTDIDHNNYTLHDWQPTDAMGQLRLDPSGGWLGYTGNPSGVNMVVDNGLISLLYPLGIEPDSPSTNILGEQAKTIPSLHLTRPGAGQASSAIRENFAESAFWLPAIVTNGGEARVAVTFPDSLTLWRLEARAVAATSATGSAICEVVTNKKFIVRMQAPRFFVVGDKATLSANVHNYTNSDKRVKVGLDLGDGLKIAGIVTNGSEREIDVKSAAQDRMDWMVTAVKPGSVRVLMTAKSASDSDAVLQKFPVVVHGAVRFIGGGGLLGSNDVAAKQTFDFTVPAERLRGSAAFNLQVSPSLAGTMLDALPYLADYPYGNTEETLSRFAPAVVVARVLHDSGVDFGTLRSRAMAEAGELKASKTEGNVQNSVYTQPKGLPDSRDFSALASNFSANGHLNPVYDQATLDAMVHAGLARIDRLEKSMQGGWGCWDESDRGDPYMTGYVLNSLCTVRSAGVKVSPYTLYRGFKFLEHWLASQDELQLEDPDNRELLAWVTYVLSERSHLPAGSLPTADRYGREPMESEGSQEKTPSAQTIARRLFDNREHLSPYSQSLLALALFNFGDKSSAEVLVRNLENTAAIDNEQGTAHWVTGSSFWRWWNGDVETTSWALRALLQIDPENQLAPQLVKWLVGELRGSHWSNTRDTAFAVFALAEYARAHKQLTPTYDVKVTLNGKLRRIFHVTPRNSLVFANRLELDDSDLVDGVNHLTLEKVGAGALYWSASTQYFSSEEPIKASGSHLAIQRRYFVVPENGTGTSRRELHEGDVLTGGDMVEVELTIDSPNDYDYLTIEDPKAAGLEPVNLESGTALQEGLGSDIELRDTKVVLFLDALPQGTHILRYRMRAETPGLFHVLPTNAYATYAPEVRANSDEMHIDVRDAVVNFVGALP